jgi:hypothetical protein
MLRMTKQLVWFSCILFLGCSNRGADFDLVRDFNKATNIYYGADVAAAEVALLRFVTATEANSKAARADVRADYIELMDISWLRLASVYQSQSNPVKFRLAMARSEEFFDQDRKVRNDPRYMKDKESSLLEFLRNIEASDMPMWKRNGKTAIDKRTG